MDQSQIDFFDLARLELRRKGMVRAISPGNDERAAGFTIEAMDDAGTQIAIHRRQRAEVMEQRVDEGAAAMPRPGVDHHACGLIDHDDVGVFIQDFERQIFGLGFEGR